MCKEIKNIEPTRQEQAETKKKIQRKKITENNSISAFSHLVPLVNSSSKRLLCADHIGHWRHNGKEDTPVAFKKLTFHFFNFNVG